MFFQRSPGFCSDHTVLHVEFTARPVESRVPASRQVVGLPRRCSEGGLSCTTGRISSSHGIAHSLVGSDRGVSNIPLTRDSCQPHGRVPYIVVDSNDHSVGNSPLVRDN